MKHLFSFAATALLAGALSGQDLQLGSRVDDFTVTNLKGAPVTFQALKGNFTVIAFIATQCPVSNAYNDRMIALSKDYAPKGVKFIFINSNSNEPASVVEQHARSVGFVFPVYKDRNNVVADRFGAQATPEMVVIDSAGIIRYHGYIDDSKDQAKVTRQGLRPALDQLMAGQVVVVPQTKAFGCTIKRVKGTS